MQMGQYIFHKKAQLFTTDAIVATAIVALILGLMMFYWTISATEINKRQDMDEIQRASLDTSNYLMKIGLVNKSNTFDRNKLLELAGCNYTTYDDQIGLSGFGYFINLTYINGTQVTIGSNITQCGGDYTNSTDIMSVRRMGAFNNNEVIMKLYVWK